MAWDALLCVEGGLPDDVLLGIPESVVLARDGYAAVRHMGSRIMTSADQSIATLHAWYNDPTPITRPSAVPDALNELERVTEQLTAHDAPPSIVQQRILLMNLMGRVPDVARAFEALQAVSDVVGIDSMVSVVRRIGDRN